MFSSLHLLLVSLSFLQLVALLETIRKLISIPNEGFKILTTMSICFEGRRCLEIICLPGSLDDVIPKKLQLFAIPYHLCIKEFMARLQMNYIQRLCRSEGKVAHQARRWIMPSSGIWRRVADFSFTYMEVIFRRLCDCYQRALSLKRGRVCNWELLLGLVSRVFLRPESRWIHNYILLLPTFISLRTRYPSCTPDTVFVLYGIYDGLLSVQDHYLINFVVTMAV
jgi:hypothetical protein